MATTTQIKNIETVEVQVPIEETKSVTLTKADFQASPYVRYQAGEIYEDLSIHWTRGRGKKAQVFWEDNCAVIDGVLYSCLCDGVYFDERVGKRFVAAIKHMDELLEANNYCARILEVLPVGDTEAESTDVSEVDNETELIKEVEDEFYTDESDNESYEESEDED